MILLPSLNGVGGNRTMKKMFVSTLVSFWIVFLLAVPSANAAKQQPRSFYLTQGMFTGAQALLPVRMGIIWHHSWKFLTSRISNTIQHLV
jgi:hypothetical protein